MTTEYSSKYVFTDEFGKEHVVSKTDPDFETLCIAERLTIDELRRSTNSKLTLKLVSYTQKDVQ